MGGLEFTLWRKNTVGRFLQICCIGSILLLVFVTLEGIIAAHGPASLALLLGGKANHVTLGILFTIFLLFTHTITMFYFIGTGSAVKEVARTNAALVPLYEKTRRFKARTSGLLTLAPVLLMASSIAGAGVAGGSIAPSIHLAMALVAVVFNLFTLWRVCGVIGENIDLMAEANRLA